MSDQVEPNDAEKKSPVYTYEWTVYHKRRYIAHFFEQEMPDYVNTTKKRLAAIQQALGMSRTNVMHEVLQAGLEKLEDEIREGRGKVPEPGEKGHETWAIAQEYRRIWEKRQRILDLEPIYNERGLEGFITWCEENNVEYKDFLKYFTWRSPMLSHNERAESWLREYLEPLDDGVPREEVFSAAWEAGILHDGYNEDSLRKVGERLELHKGDPRHGYWRWNG